VIINLIGILVIIARPEKLAFPIVMALALISLLSLVW
jgi:hypothetical protein